MKKIKEFFTGSISKKKKKTKKVIPKRLPPQQNQYQQQSPYQNNYQQQVQQQAPFQKDIKLEDLPLIKRQKKQKNVQLDVEKMIRFYIQSRFPKIKKTNSPQKIPVMLSLLSDEVEVDEDRAGLDLIIMIDVSGSMSGEKIKLVKETLNFIVDQLTDIDRLGLTTFNNSSSLLSNLTPMTKENREEYKNIINGIKAGGGTNIIDAVDLGMEMMIQRKEVNETTAGFFLSDGQNNGSGTLNSLKKLMKDKDDILKKKGMNYKFHSFGYGAGHDENWLTAINNFTDGNFYYIKENKLIDECFIDCLGSLLSIIAKEVKINLFLDKDCKFVQKFGDSWKDKNDKKTGVINVDSIISDMDKDYMAEIEIGKLPNNVTEIKVAFAILSYKSDQGENSKTVELVLKITNDDNLGEINQKVEETFVKMEAGQHIKEYEEMAEQGKHKEADEMMNNFNQKVNKNTYLKKEYRDKITQITKKEKLMDKKYTKQNYKMMCSEQYAPGYSNFKGQRSKAKKMKAMKK